MPFKRYEKKPVFEGGNFKSAMQVIPFLLPVALIAGGVIGIGVGMGVAFCSATVAGIASAPLWGAGIGAGLGLFGVPALYLAGEAKNALSNVIGGAKNFFHDLLTGKKDKNKPAPNAAPGLPATDAWERELTAWKREYDQLKGSFSAAQGKPAAPKQVVNAPVPKRPGKMP